LTARAARHDLALRLVAGVAAAAFLATGYFLIASPAADTLSGSSDRLTASAPNAMALYNLRAAAVMDFAGPPGAGLEVAATTARLAPTTRNALFARRVMIPNVKGASFAWSAAAAPGQSVRIRFGNQRQDAIAGLMLLIAFASTLRAAREFSTALAAVDIGLGLALLYWYVRE